MIKLCYTLIEEGTVLKVGQPIKNGGNNMNKLLKKSIAIILCLAMLFSLGLPAFAENEANDEPSFSQEYVEKMEKKAKTISDILQFLVNDVLLKIVSRLIPNLSFVKEDTDSSDPSGTFYKGTETFIDTNTDRRVWKVGYGSKSILPDVFGVWVKFARGSYCPWGYATKTYKDDDGNSEDLKVRTVILDDNTGRGSAVFCSVDCIGLSNTDVMKIRAAVDGYAKEKNIVAINVSAIHTHMGIDSQGVWNAPLTTSLNNALSQTGLTTVKSGVNEDYLKTIIERTKQSIEEAYGDMKDGTLEYARTNISDYVHGRTAPYACDTDMYRLVFAPSDGSRGTVIASFGAHPEATSYDNELKTDLSADFVYYMEKLVNKTNNNFVFIQGNVGVNSCGLENSNDGLELSQHDKVIRYGYEMAYICLGMTEDEQGRKELNAETGDLLGVEKYAANEDYTVWYDGLDTVESVPVEAAMNVRMKQVNFEVENSTAQILIKLGLADNNLKYNSKTKKYYSLSEIGYMELGSKVKILMSPGETYSEILVGGYGIKNFGYPSLRELFGEDVILFDLMNDAAGYICPDSTYSVVGYKYDPKTGELKDDSWCLTVSMGKNTASKLVSEYISLVESVR